MAKCKVCNNEYDKAFEIVINGESHTFDCFECAISALAPECAQCNTKIIGHGIENQDNFYCCAHCAKQQGVTDAQDRVD